ncbi:rabphilin-3A-like isoform X2 [Macrobrachium nipponense]|uniref:rabphilin-3A-like isoform X2 n=1 Tax=Macrobrachium nipponense TaxID=159736 RepID=UPI0030C7F1C5
MDPLNRVGGGGGAGGGVGKKVESGGMGDSAPAGATGGGPRAPMARRASLGNQPMTERWVCPNDRQLALRAKLKMGWSTSQPAPVQRQDSLSEAETKMILEVIKRAEQLDMNEQQRIGRLVERVEAMKNRVQGNGNNNCILCGEGLSVLRTSSQVCADCNKRVCSKCGVENPTATGEKLWLCKICAETREMWKRSGAWFFRGIPKHVLPASGPSSAPSTTKRSRAPPRRAHTLGVKGGDFDTDTSSEEENQRRLRLQKAASETVPHDGDNLPPANSPNPPRSRSVSPSPFRFDSSDSAGGGGGSDDRASDKSPVSPAAGTQRDLSRAPSRESTGGGDPGGLLLTPYYSPAPHSPHQLSPRTELRRDQAIDRSPSPLLRVAWRDSTRGSNSSVSDSPNLSRESKEETEPENSTPGTPSNAMTSSVTEGLSASPSASTAATPRSPHPSPLPMNRSSSSSSSGNIGGTALSSPTVNGFRSRRESEASKSSDDRRHPPRLGRNAGGSRESRDSRDSRDSLLSRDSSSIRDEVTSSSMDDVFPEEKNANTTLVNNKEKEGTIGMGTVEFSLLYDSHNQALHCTVHSARNLKPTDTSRQADAYVKLHLLPGASKGLDEVIPHTRRCGPNQQSNKLRTRTVPKTVNPEFNETLTYYGISDQDMARKTLRLTILDEDRFGHDFLGEARIALKKVRPHETKRLRVNLEKRISLAEDEVKGETERGKVLLSLKYATQRNALIVGIVRCAHLPSMDSNGFSDPYVKVQLKPDPTHKKYKTAVKWKNLNPEFNEEFIFEVRRNELPKKLLDIRVYDKDVGRSDDFIGGLQLSQDSTGTELRHWYDALQYPDRRHDRWHQLQLLNGK